LRPFVQRGGESVATEDKGNVYVANGQIFVYDSHGKQTGVIDVPERPLQVIADGQGRGSLFVLAHHTLFRIEAHR
jgi:sugar lactone lactonase YvrE